MKTLIFDLDGTIADVSSLSIYATPEMLPQDFVFALVTASPRPEALFVLERAGLRSFFKEEFMFCAGEYPGSKSEGAPYVMLKEIIGENGVVIGDSDTDELGAKVAGYPCVRVREMATTDEQRRELQNAINRAVTLFQKIGT